MLFALLSLGNPKYRIVRKDAINQEETEVILTEGCLSIAQVKIIQRNKY